MREKLIEAALVCQAKAAGGEAMKFVSPGRVGTPDRIVLLPGGRVLFVEVKSEGVRPDPHQLREHARLRELGFRVEVVDSMQSVKEILQ